MSEVEKNVEGSVVNCESLVEVIKRDFGNQYLEWKKVWFKSQFFLRIKHFREARFESS